MINSDANSVNTKLTIKSKPTLTSGSNLKSKGITLNSFYKQSAKVSSKSGTTNLIQASTYNKKHLMQVQQSGHIQTTGLPTTGKITHAAVTGNQSIVNQSTQNLHEVA